MLAPDPVASFPGRRVLVTGHTGFKGAWLSTWLDTLGAQVAGLSDREPGRGAFGDLGVASFTDHVLGDVADASDAASRMASVEPEIVFHLAAQPLVRRSWVDRTGTFATNVLGTVNVVDAAFATPSVRAVVVVTTDKVYENHELGRPFVETDRLGGHDPYSASKAAAELALAPYRDAVHMGLDPRPLVAARAGNVIGGGDWAEDRLVPDIVRAMEAGEPVVLRRPDAVRPWQHVLDCLWGYLVVAAAMLDGHQVAPAYNFAHGTGARTVLDVARRAVHAWGAPDSSIVIEREDTRAEAQLLQLDASLAASDLGWAPKWDIERSIDETIAFYRADDPAAEGRRQLEEHLATEMPSAP